MSIAKTGGVFKRKWEKVQVAALSPYLTDVDIERGCRDLGHCWRQSPFPPSGVVRSMIFRALHPDKSIENTVEHLVADGILGRRISKSAWDQARGRLPQALLPALVQQTAAAAVGTFPGKWHGRSVYLVDATTVSMPDEASLSEAFGHWKSKHGPSRFPVARLTAILHAGSRSIVDYRLGHYRTSELVHFREMLRDIPKNSIWVGDRYFSSTVEAVLSQRQDVDFLTRLHQRRDGKRLAREGTKLGRDEWIICLSVSGPTRKTHASLGLPKAINARLIRHRYRTHRGERKTLWIVTSLLNADRYPRHELVELYGSRWGIETHFGYLKTLMKMAVLRSKTEANVRSEVAAFLLAHNLIWRLIHEAAELTRVEPGRISFSGALHVAMAYSIRLRYEDARKREDIYISMLKRIAKMRVPSRPGRHEPRLRKRDPQSFGVLRVSREEARRCA